MTVLKANVNTVATSGGPPDAVATKRAVGDRHTVIVGGVATDYVVQVVNSVLTFVQVTAAPSSTFKATVGSGLPSFAGRTPGDIHFDPSNNREYILTGAAGTTVVDDLNRASLGTTSSNGASISTSNGQIVGNAFRINDPTASGLYSSNLGGSSGTVSLDITLQSNSDTSNAVYVFLGGNSATDLANGWRLMVRPDSVAVSGPASQSIANPGASAGTPVNYVLDVGTSTWRVLRAGSVIMSGTYSTPPAGTWLVIDIQSSQFGGQNPNTSFDNVNAFSSGTLVWTQSQSLAGLGYVTPSLASLGAAKSTVGAGLPGFSGRNNGDLHLETTSGRSYTLTGTPGTAASDSFDGAAGTALQGRVTPVGAKTWYSNGLVLTGDGAVVSPSNGSSYIGTIPVGAGRKLVSCTYDNNRGGNTNPAYYVGLIVASGGDFGGGNVGQRQIIWGGDRFTVYEQAGFGSGGIYTSPQLLNYSDCAVGRYVFSSQENADTSLTVTMEYPTVAGGRATVVYTTPALADRSSSPNVGISTNLAAALDFTFTAPGSLAWQTTQPVREGVNAQAAGGATQTIPDPDTGTTMSRIVLSANITIALPTPAPGKSFSIAIVQAASGSGPFTVAFTTPSGVVKWQGGTAYAASTTASAVDVLTFSCFNVDWLASFGKAFA